MASAALQKLRTVDAALRTAPSWLFSRHSLATLQGLLPTRNGKSRPGLIANTQRVHRRTLGLTETCTGSSKHVDQKTECVPITTHQQSDVRMIQTSKNHQWELLTWSSILKRLSHTTRPLLRTQWQTLSSQLPRQITRLLKQLLLPHFVPFFLASRVKGTRHTIYRHLTESDSATRLANRD